MPVIGGMEGSLHAVEIEEGVQLPDLVGADDLHRDTHAPPDGQDVPDEVHLIVEVGDPHAAAAVP